MTVVMATLGGETLGETIAQLNRGTVFPAEILVCIPEKEAPRTAGLRFPNVRVIVTDCRGQVAQRAIGFQNASYDVVMQLDDDIRVNESCLSYLLETLHAYAPHVAVAPALDEKSDVKLARMENGFFLKAFYLLINGRAGYRMGTVSRAGAEFSCDPSKVGGGVYDVEWVPGGCVLHFRENLIKKNYFPFRGKAYCEDLMHSYYLIKKGVRLKFDARATCSLESNPLADSGIKEVVKTISGDYRARKYFVRISSRSILRMHLFYLALVFNYLVKKFLMTATHR